MRLDALDWLNFLLADVRGGVGAYVNVYLVTEARWDQATLGAVLTVSGLLGILLHPFVGDFIDRTRAKRALIIASTALLAAAALAIWWVPTVPVVLAADILMAVLGGVFAPTIAAISLGLTKRMGLPARLGRNAAFDRAGNVFIAALAGALGLVGLQWAPFFLAPVFGVLTAFAALSIPGAAIDHEKARGLTPQAVAPEARIEPGWRSLLRIKPLVVLAAAAALFHFANAPMLPLVAQKLALANPGFETSLTSAAIMVAQFATILMALVVTLANRIGRKPLLLIAFAALPLRAALCAMTDNPTSLLAIQLLDGIGGGLFEALLPLVLADIMAGSGHYSLARGVVGTVQGIGGSSSQFVAGSIVVSAGYGSAFLTLMGVALVALLLVALMMPETTPKGERSQEAGL